MNKAELIALIQDQVPSDANINASAVVQVLKSVQNGVSVQNPGSKFMCIIVGPETDQTKEVMNFFERSCGGVTDVTIEDDSDSDPEV